MPDVVVGALPGGSGLHRQHLLVRSNPWIWLSASQHRDDRVVRRGQVEPDDVGDLGDQFRIVENLNVSAFHGLTPYSLHTCATVEWSTPTRRASSRDQCVTPRLFGGGFSVSVMILAWSTIRVRRGRFRFSRPAIPHAAYRDRQRFTVGLLIPTRAAIS